MQPTKGYRKVQILTAEHARYLRFTFHGSYDYEDYHLAVIRMCHACREKGYEKALIDLLLVEGNMPDHDRHTLGMLFAEYWKSDIKIAGLAPEEKINRFLENTAVNRGVRLRAFYEEKPALEWLMKP